MKTDVAERLEKLRNRMRTLSAELALSKAEMHMDREDCERAIEVIRKTKQTSVSHFQLQLGRGYNHAAKILDLLEQRGVVGPQVGAVSREIFFDKMPKTIRCRKQRRRRDGKQE